MQEYEEFTSLFSTHNLTMAAGAIGLVVVVYLIYTYFIKQGFAGYGISDNYWALRNKQHLYGAPIPKSYTQSMSSSPFPEHLTSSRSRMVQGMTGGAPSDAVLSAIGAGTL